MSLEAAMELISSEDIIASFFGSDPFEQVIDVSDYPEYKGDYSVKSQLEWAQKSYADDMEMKESLIRLQSILLSKGISDDTLDYYVSLYEKIDNIWSPYIDSNEKVTEDFVSFMNRNGGIDYVEQDSADTQRRIAEYTEGLKGRVSSMV